MKQKEIIIKSIKTPKARNEIFHYNFRFRLLDSKKAATSENNGFIGSCSMFDWHAKFISTWNTNKNKKKMLM